MDLMPSPFRHRLEKSTPGLRWLDLRCVQLRRVRSMAQNCSPCVGKFSTRLPGGGIHHELIAFRTQEEAGQLKQSSSANFRAVQKQQQQEQLGVFRVTLPAAKETWLWKSFLSASCFHRLQQLGLEIQAGGHRLLSSATCSARQAKEDEAAAVLQREFGGFFGSSAGCFCTPQIGSVPLNSAQLLSFGMVPRASKSLVANT